MIYELRIYTTRSGRMKEVVNASATVAQSIRGGDRYGKLIGHWWSSIGRLNQYIHMWQYKNVEEMRNLRSELSQLEDWKTKFVPLVAPHIITQEIRLLRPAVEIKNSKGENNIYEIRISKLNVGFAVKFVNCLSEIRDKIDSSSVNIGIWNTELSDPNEVVHLWSHKNLEDMVNFWQTAESNNIFKEFNEIMEQGVRYDENIILSPSSCSPLK